MRMLFFLGGLLLFSSAGWAGINNSSTCHEEVGHKEAATLVRQCLQISPATHPPCNAENPCALIKSEIVRGCEFARGIADANLPGFCAGLPAER